MAKQILNVGTHNNDKTGDTLRAGGLKIKANFDEIYAALAADGMTITGGNLLKSGSWSDIRNKPDFKSISTTASFNDLVDKPALVVATATPGSLVGYQGQQAGEIAFDGNNLYVSVADYDGTSIIWKYIPWGGNGTTQGYTYRHNQNPSIQGGFSLDNSNPAQATAMYISTHDVDGNNIHPFYQYIFDNQLGFLLEVINRTNPNNRAVFEVTHSAEMEANGEEYYALSLTPIMSTNNLTIDSGMWDLHFDFTGLNDGTSGGSGSGASSYQVTINQLNGDWHSGAPNTFAMDDYGVKDLYVISQNGAAKDITLTLPATPAHGKMHTIKFTGKGSSPYSLIVAASQMIDNVADATVTIEKDGGYATFVWDNDWNTWWITGKDLV